MGFVFILFMNKFLSLNFNSDLLSNSFANWDWCSVWHSPILVELLLMLGRGVFENSMMMRLVLMMVMEWE
jgi:hypothetical protein